MWEHEKEVVDPLHHPHLHDLPHYLPQRLPAGAELPHDQGVVTFFKTKVTIQ